MIIPALNLISCKFKLKMKLNLEYKIGGLPKKWSENSCSCSDGKEQMLK